MDDLFIYILIAAVTGLVGWGGYMLVQGFGDGERRKLVDRLASPDRLDPDRAADGRHSIVLQQMQASGLPPRLAAQVEGERGLGGGLRGSVHEDVQKCAQGQNLAAEAARPVEAGG